MQFYIDYTEGDWVESILEFEQTQQVRKFYILFSGPQEENRPSELEG